MSAHSSRLLLLGAVRIFEPVNAYQIRRELISWNVDQWAHVNPGSVYSVLGTLARQGFVVRHDIDDARRSVAVYTMTLRGHAEFVQLMERAMTTVDLSEPLMFHTALSMLPHLDRGDVRIWLFTRIARLRELAGAEPAPGPGSPPHVHVMLDLWRREADLQLTWCEELVARVDSGEFDFAGEDGTWLPPEGDPGWQMVEDRARYRKILGLD